MEANITKAKELRKEAIKRNEVEELSKLIIVTLGQIKRLSKYVGTEADKLSLWAITKRFNESVDKLEKLLKD